MKNYLVILSGLIVLCGYVQGAPVQWAVAEGGNDHYYLAVSVPEGISWIDANDVATHAGGYLVTITSEAENIFAFNLVDDDIYWHHFASGNNCGPWLGGMRDYSYPNPEEGWQWVTGESFTYTNWYSGTGEPTGGIWLGKEENRLQFSSATGTRGSTWNDIPDEVTAEYAVYGFIIEFGSEPASSLFDAVVFTDANLEVAVEDQLGVADPTPLDMLALKDLNANNRGISDLTGLEFALNIEELYVGNNSISDISPLSGLSELRLLELPYNDVNDVSPLADLTKLKNLKMRNNKISDILMLDKLVNIRLFWISANKIEDISVLSNYPYLDNLMINNNPILDYTALASADNLRHLNTVHNENFDTSVLADMYQMLALYLSNCGVNDLSFLSDLEELTTIALKYNQIDDLTPLMNLNKVKYLYLEGNLLEDISPLTTKTTLEALSLHDNALSANSFCVLLPEIQANNPNLETLTYDPNPWACHSADFSGNGPVNLLDFSILAGKWSLDNCTDINSWCDKADVNHSGTVDSTDLSIFALYWLDGTTW